MAATISPLKIPLPDTEARLVHTRITDTQDDRLWVDHPECNVARRAFSCLIEPLAGDLVLLAVDPAGGPGHVLAVLERPGPQRADLVLPEGGAILARDGEVALRAKSLRFEGREGVTLDAGRLEVAAVSAATTIKHWQGWFDTLEANAVSIEYAAKTLSSKVGRLLSRTLESFRSVEGLDEIRAGRSRTRVRDDHRLEAGHITARADGFVKIDGQKIDLG
ncbi:DUF3540 domain-containing protein [Castellaniella sp. GW247-6E4]|uniref:DUF3540 domain-containing protein n=1 Tax=Castellaniella sp. GW247-6E4 TaxID=3140380 RepID=UPI003315C27B